MTHHLLQVDVFASYRDAEVEMPRYIVLTADPEERGAAPLFIESHAPVLCDTVEEIGPVIRQAQRDRGEWMLFDVVDGRARRRAVVFHRDGSIESVE